MRLLPLPLLALGLLCTAAPASAQSANNYGSIYSRFGLGERTSYASSLSEAMGGAGVALRSPFYNGLANPALWADRAFTDFTATVEARSVESTDAADTRARASGGGLAGLALAFPLYTERLGFTIAFRPYSRVDYRTVEEGEFTPDEGANPVTYRTNFEGGGGLHQLQAGLGARLSPALRVGASVDGYFGVLEYLQRTEFPDNTAYAETRSTQSTQLAGVSGTLGAVFTTSGFGGEGSAFHVGAAVSLPARLSGERVRTLGVSLDQDTLSTAQEGSLTLPLSARAGLAFTSPRWTLAADVLYEPWGAFDGDFAFGGFDPAAGLDELTDRLRVGGGFQFVPNGTDRTAGYFRRAGYRLGAYVENGYLAPGGTDLQTMAVTGGLSLPTLFPTARLDLGVEAGRRGSTDGVLVRDVFIRGTATIKFGERWFVRRRLG